MMLSSNALKISLLSVAVAAMSTQAMAEGSDPIKNAFKNATTNVGFRYRAESVDQTGKEDALASTLKSRITVKSGDIYGASVLMEADNVTILGSDRYNDLTGDPDRASYATVVDPAYTEVNQAALMYNAPANTKLAYGRQRVIFDNQRFVGGVGWRQNEQTFDGFTLSNTALDRTTLTYGYVYNVNTIRGLDLDGGKHHLVNGRFDASPALSVTGYAYLLDKLSAAIESHDTYGVSAKGKIMSGDIGLLYQAEYATQSVDGTVDFDADYYFLEGGAEIKGITGKLGYEVQTSDDGKGAFTTPLGTNHAFNGWADLFLVTPTNGLEDLYLSVSTPLLGPALTVAYHDFSADFGGQDYGSEIDVSLAKTFAESYTVLLKFADFNTDSTLPDTQKIWLQFEALF